MAEDYRENGMKTVEFLSNDLRMIVNKLDACRYDSIKPVKETLSQMNRSDFREDVKDMG